MRIRVPRSLSGGAQPQLSIGEAFAQRELAQPRCQQRLERVGKWATEQLHRAGVDQAAQQWAAAVPPPRGEVVERASCIGTFANPKGPQRLRCA